MGLRIYTLGPFCVYRGDELLPPAAWKTQKSKTLLKLLFTFRRRQLTRDQLLEWLWPDLDPAAADRSLRIAVSQLRETLAPGRPRGSHSSYILTTDSGYAWNPQGDYWLDAAEFEAAATQFEADDQLAVGERVRALYRGEYLEEDRYADWAAAERERLREIYFAVLTRLAEAYARHGSYPQATALCRQVLAGDRCRESAWRLLMRYHYHAGNRALALRAYEECRQALTEELQVEPLPETRALYEQIQHVQVPTLPRAIPNNLTLHTPLTPFVGRDTELAQIAALLRDPACRLLTLVGAGGMGKTRLALQAARQNMEAFPHGVYFVPLAAVASPDLLVSAIADAVGLKLAGVQEPRLQLYTFLADRQVLLVLDSLEQLLTDHSVEILLALLQSAPECKCLVTSRERLDVQAEWLCAVDGLEYPSGPPDGRAGPEDYTAVRLFAQTARRVRAGFSLRAESPFVVRICQALEGMPLGVELAAAAAAYSPCRDLAEHLSRSLDALATSTRDLPPRHRSMRAVFDWSWQLLADEERVALRNLVVFHGGFYEPAAQQVAGAPPRLLAALLRKSLLRQDAAGRYSLHELLRQYLEEQWRQEPAVALHLHEAHCACYTGFVAQREQRLRGAEQKPALEEIHEDMDNVRAAWQWAVAQGRAEPLDRCLEGLYLYYDFQSLLHEAHAAFGQAVERLQPAASWDDPDRARVLLGKLQARQAMFAYRLGQIAQAQELLHASIALLEPLPQPRELAFALYTLGYLTSSSGETPAELAEGRRLLEKSLAICRELDLKWLVTRVLNALGLAYDRVGDLERVRQVHAEGLAVAREIGDRRTEAHHLEYLGEALAHLGQPDAAEELHRASLALFKELDIQWGVAGSSVNLVCDLLLLRRYQEAMSRALESFALFKRLGIPYGIMSSLRFLGESALGVGDLVAAHRYFEQALRATLEYGTTVVDSALPLALCYATGGRLVEALEVGAWILEQPDVPPWFRGEVERMCDEVAAQLPAKVASAARARWRVKSPEEIVRESWREIQGYSGSGNDMDSRTNGSMGQKSESISEHL